MSSALDHSARRDPGESDYNTNTQSKGLNINAPLSALQIYIVGKVKQSRLLPLSMAAFNPITYGRI